MNNLQPSSENEEDEKKTFLQTPLNLEQEKKKKAQALKEMLLAGIKRLKPLVPLSPEELQKQKEQALAKIIIMTDNPSKENKAKAKQQTAKRKANRDAKKRFLEVTEMGYMTAAQLILEDRAEIINKASRLPEKTSGKPFNEILPSVEALPLNKTEPEASLPVPMKVQTELSKKIGELFGKASQQLFDETLEKKKKESSFENQELFGGISQAFFDEYVKQERLAYKAKQASRHWSQVSDDEEEI